MTRTYGTKDYSIDLRMKVVLAHERDGDGYKKLSKRFDIPLPSVKSIIRVSEQPKCFDLRDNPKIK